MHLCRVSNIMPFQPFQPFQSCATYPPLGDLVGTITGTITGGTGCYETTRQMGKGTDFIVLTTPTPYLPAYLCMVQFSAPRLVHHV